MGFHHGEHLPVRAQACFGRRYEYRAFPYRLEIAAHGYIQFGAYTWTHVDGTAQTETTSGDYTYSHSDANELLMRKMGL